MNNFYPERRFTATTSAAANDGSVRASFGGAGGKVRGYAAVFYKPGDPSTQFRLAPDIIERLAPGCFDEAVKGADVVALFNHDPSMLLGRTKSRTLRLSTDARGLRYEVDLPDTTTGRDVRALVKRGDLSGASFGFIVGLDEWTREAGMCVRTIVAVKVLYDVSPVTSPAYAGARVSGGSASEAAPAGFDEGDDDAVEAGAEAARSAARGRNINLHEKS